MSVRRILLVSAIFLAEAVLIAFALIQQFPPSGDDYSYLYQAKLFASGKMYAEDPLYNKAGPLHHFVDTNNLIDNQGRRFSKYPPGWPALLALGALFRVPWLVDPILGAVLVFLILRYAEQQSGENGVKTAGLLMTLCLFFCYYAASLRAHMATALFVFAAFVAYDGAQRRNGNSRLLLFSAGALLGYSSMIRYIDWVPLGAWIGVDLLRRKRFAALTFVGVGFGLLASGNLIYDVLFTGHPFHPPPALNHSHVHDNLLVTWTGFQVTGVRLVNLLWVFPPALLLLALWKPYQASPKIKMYLALFLMDVGIYFFYPASAGGPGPRYLLTYFPFLVLAVVDVYTWICQDGTHAPRRLWKLAIALQIVGSVSFAAIQGYTSYQQRDLERTARQAGDGEKIFLLKTGTYHANAGDLTRNPPVMSAASTLYFNARDETGQDALLKRFPGRNVFVYEYPGRLNRLADSQ